MLQFVDAKNAHLVDVEVRCLIESRNCVLRQSGLILWNRVFCSDGKTDRFLSFCIRQKVLLNSLKD